MLGYCDYKVGIGNWRGFRRCNWDAGGLFAQEEEGGSGGDFFAEICCSHTGNKDVGSC